MAIIFDLDGVLIHSMPLHNRSWEVYLERHGIPADKLEERMHGRRNDEIVRAFFGDDLDEQAVIDHGAAKEALFREMMQPEMERWIVPGMREFFARHGNIPIGLASNAERKNIDFVLDGAAIRNYFHAVVDGDQTPRPKPYPDIYIHAAGLLGVQPADCIIFEDSHTGIEAALGSGARVVGLTTTLPNPPGVHLVIDDFNDNRLEPWLSRQVPIS
jgi:HAD superfamily hydrolase (TIGR01509 family)